MSVACQTLYNDVLLEVGAGSANPKLAQAFPRAVNRALDQMSDAADLATRHSHVTAVDSIISSLAARYEYVLYAGVLFWLIRMGHKPRDPKMATVVYEDSRDNWEDSRGMYVVDLDNETQSDEDNDVTRLGSVTD